MTNKIILAVRRAFYIFKACWNIKQKRINRKIWNSMLSPSFPLAPALWGLFTFPTQIFLEARINKAIKKARRALEKRTTSNKTTPKGSQARARICPALCLRSRSSSSSQTSSLCSRMTLSSRSIWRRILLSSMTAKRVTRFKIIIAINNQTRTS